MDSIYSLSRTWEISAGMIQRFTVENAFGRNPDVDTATDPEDVWNYGGLQTYMAAAAELHISSSNGADTQVIAIDYLDVDWLRQTGLIALQGQTEVNTGITAIRVLNVYNPTGVALLGDVYVYEDCVPVAGVPNDPTKVHGKIDIGRERSQMALFSVPRFHDAYIVQLWAAINNDKGWARMALYVRRFGGVFQVYPEMGLDEVTSNYVEVIPVVPIQLNELMDVKWTCMEVEANDTDVSAGFSIILDDLHYKGA
jgi:hypothetical protein